MSPEERHLLAMIESGLAAMRSPSLATKGCIALGFECLGLLRELMQALFIRYDEEFAGPISEEFWHAYYSLEDVITRLPEPETEWIDAALGKLS